MIAVAPSWWQGDDVPRVGFTAFAAKTLEQSIPIDQTSSDSEAQIIQRRQDVLMTLVGIRTATSNRAVRHANVVSRN